RVRGDGDDPIHVATGHPADRPECLLRARRPRSVAATLMPRPLFSHVMNLRETAHPPVARQTIAGATDTVFPSNTVWLTNGTGGGITFSSTPTVRDGQDTDVCLILNISAQPFTFTDQGTLANSNLRLSAATITLGTRDSLWLIFSADIGDWVQIGTTNVI